MDNVMAGFLSWLSGQSLPARIMRLPLRVIPRNTVVPILSGAMRGAKWISGSEIQACYLGGYERPLQMKVQQLVRPDSVFYDIGANVGFYTILASRLVGLNGSVISFEPVPRNIQLLYRHMMLNDIHNVVIREAAVGEQNGKARLLVAGKDWSTAQLTEDGELEVTLVSIDQCFRGGDA
jgi:hypothetical protein